MAFNFLKKTVSKIGESINTGLARSVEKLKTGLTKTRDVFVGGLKSLLRGRKLDQALLNELEQRLITSDLGVTATNRIMTDLQAAYKEKRISPES